MTKSKTQNPEPQANAMEMAQAMIGANPKVMEAWLELMNDSARFFADRLKTDQETQRSLLSCKTPTELMQIQSEFFKDAVEQYTAQTARMFEKMTEATRVTLTESTTGMKRSYDDVPL